MHREVPHAFVVLALLLTDERSNSAEPLNMLGVWIPIRTRSKSFRDDPSKYAWPIPSIQMDGLRYEGNSCSPSEGGVHYPLGAPSFGLLQGAFFDVPPLR